MSVWVKWWQNIVQSRTGTPLWCGVSPKSAGYPSKNWLGFKVAVWKNLSKRIIMLHSRTLQTINQWVVNCVWLNYHLGQQRHPCLFVGWFVCLSAGWHKKYSADFDESFIKGASWPTLLLIGFWTQGQSKVKSMFIGHNSWKNWHNFKWQMSNWVIL